MEIESKQFSNKCAGTGLSERLKKETTEEHHRAESAPIQELLINGQILKNDFINYYSNLYHLHLSVEETVNKYRSQEMWLDDLCDKYRNHSNRLHKDLVLLGVNPLETDVPPCCHHADQCDSSEIVGWVYTLEGSMNGNDFLLEKLKNNSILIDMKGQMLYLNPYGDSQKQEWLSFKHKLDSLPLSIAEQENAINGAKNCFNAVRSFSYIKNKG